MKRSLTAVLFTLIAVVSLRDSFAVEPPAAAVPPVGGLAVGSTMPVFSSTDDQGQPWKSTEHIGKKVLVFYFYPGDFTGGCTRQAQSYRDTLAKIEEQGVEVIGVSGDQVSTHKLFKETYELTHSLLADPKGEIAKLVGVPVKTGGKVRAKGPDLKPLLDEGGNRIDLEREATFDRWTVVVDKNGKIVSLRSAINPVADAEDVLKIVKTL